jgi:hypothetical protein
VKDETETRMVMLLYIRCDSCVESCEEGDGSIVLNYPLILT